MKYLIIYYRYYVFGGLHLPLGWFASSDRVVCIVRLGGLHLPLTPQHTDPHPCTRPPSTVHIHFFVIKSSGKAKLKIWNYEKQKS